MRVNGTVDSVLSTVRDITERKREEEALRRNQNQLRALIENVNAGVALIDEAGRFSLYNSRFLKMFGLAPDSDVMNVNDQDWSAWQVFDEGGRLLDVDEHPVRKAALTRHPVRDQLVGVLLPQGREITWLLISAEPLFSADGRVESIICTYGDLTERKKAEQMREEYISLISHDLRGPLTSILGMTQWLEHSLVAKGLTQEAHSGELIERSAKRMNAMIQDLVDSARLETGKMEMHLEHCDLLRLVTDVIERTGTLEDRWRLRVEAPEYVPVLVDPQRFERAISNLIGNALKYSAPATPVVVRLASQDGQAVLSVIDQGVGIPPEDLPHLFQRHFRSRTAGQREGLGLGLYITRLIVEAHGGKVWAESQVGKGSTFHISLPLARGSRDG